MTPEAQRLAKVLAKMLSLAHNEDLSYKYLIGGLNESLEEIIEAKMAYVRMLRTAAKADQAPMAYPKSDLHP
jgi:hypothetical protein